MEDQAWLWIDKPDETVGMESGKYDEFGGKVAVKVDQRLGFEGKHIARRECKGEIEKDGMGACTSEIVHPIINTMSEYSMRGHLHLGFSSIDTLLPDQMITVSVNDRVPCMRRVKHLGRVEDE
jgi:hypothetical protein